MGLASFPDDADSPEEIINCADKALYFSKEHGRNRYEVYGKVGNFQIGDSNGNQKKVKKNQKKIKMRQLQKKNWKKIQMKKLRKKNLISHFQNQKKNPKKTTKKRKKEKNLKKKKPQKN